MAMTGASQPRKSLHGERFDVIVIGGGINGVAIARECAAAGRRVLLLEQSDFASGTTSRATRIIHGGLRYLEHGDLALVRESLREREVLLQNHNHLIRRLNFVLALSRGGGIKHSALAVRTGLWLYRRLGYHPRLPVKAEQEMLEAALDRGLQLRFFSYSDAQCEYPERLTVEWLTQAIASGAAARNYTQVLRIRTGNGQVRGVLARDLLTGEEFSASGEWVINATGPWVDAVNSRSDRKTRIGRLIGGIRGSHLVFNRIPPAIQPLLENRTAIYTEAVDGRPIFAIPWAGQLLFGTTEVAQADADTEDPARVEASPEEVSYLLTSARRLFGNQSLSEDDVHYAYAGVRPLPYTPGKSMSAVTRSHTLHDHADDGIEQYISVIGGKLTTAGSLARECARKIGCDVPEPVLTVVSSSPENGFETTSECWIKAIAGMSGLQETQIRAIAEWHGPRALCIIRAAAHDPTLQHPIVPGSNHLVAEAVEAVQFECAVKLSDILLRRTPIALGPDWSVESTQVAAQNIGNALRWDERRIEMEAEEFEMERRLFLRKVHERTSA